MEISERLIYFISSFWSKQNVRNFAWGTFLCVLLNIYSNIAEILKFGTQYLIHTKICLVWTVAYYQKGDWPLFKPMVT